MFFLHNPEAILMCLFFAFDFLERLAVLNWLFGKFHFVPHFFILGLVLKGKIRRRWLPLMWKMPPWEAGEFGGWGPAKFESFETVEWCDRLFTIVWGFPEMFLVDIFFAMLTSHHNWGDERVPLKLKFRRWAVERLSDVAPGTWQVPECRAHNEALWVCCERWLGHGETGKMLGVKKKMKANLPTRTATFCTWIHRFWVAFWRMLWP